ncbi:metalloregulator ArsR/SmtB family transcription factor [Kribbella sp. NPDC056861]|uniref:ArsR/SmtB family transcription factor n=1 Tax=Kribbella sp. NPDC056861 TaxID=3154857 RepID=UPI00343431ED
MPLVTTFAALADPTRLAIVQQLSRGSATMSQLTRPHTITPPAMTKHVGILVDAGLVTRRKHGRSVVCSLQPTALGEVQTWLGDLTAYWNSAIDRLETLLESDDDEQ